MAETVHIYRGTLHSLNKSLNRIVVIADDNTVHSLHLSPNTTVRNLQNDGHALTMGTRILIECRVDAGLETVTRLEYGPFVGLDMKEAVSPDWKPMMMLSNIMETKHDTAKNSLSNLR
jgi:hypothetical protein